MFSELRVGELGRGLVRYRFFYFSIDYFVYFECGGLGVRVVESEEGRRVVFLDV